MVKLKNILKGSILSAVFCVQVSLLYGQSDTIYSKEVEENIKQVENNLKPWVQTEDKELKFTLEERMKTYGVKGVSIAVINNYKIEWARGYGWADSAEQRPVTAKTLFQAGSNSKSLNAMGVLKLAQDGKLDLYTDINDYLKSWKFPYNSKSKGKIITIANLLSHTAGLSLWGFRGYKPGEKIPTNLVQILEAKKPANNEAVRSIFEPSLRYLYSGGGTTISQLIVQDVTGMPYDEYMWENVLKPLGMTHSSFTQPPSVNDSLLARGYYGSALVIGKYHIYPEQAAAGLWTTPTDMAKYIIETELALQGKSQKVLSQEMTKLRLTPYVDTANGMGFFIWNQNGVKYFDHGGGNEGFGSEFIGSFEDGNGVVVMMNNGIGWNFLYEIIFSVATTYDWKNGYIPVIKKEIEIPEKDLEKYTGKYRFWKGTLKVYKSIDGLSIDADDDVKYKIHFTDNSHFFLLERDGDFYFKINKRGKVTGISKNMKAFLRMHTIKKHLNKIKR
jgi:CubicO group peptidase (beta-lactamase class C family)